MGFWSWLRDVLAPPRPPPKLPPPRREPRSTAPPRDRSGYRPKDPVTFWRKSAAELKASRTIQTARGERVASKAEARIANVLAAIGMDYQYEPKMHGWWPDFYLPRHDLVIEYWGSDAPESPKRKAKIATYLRNGHNLIGLEPHDWRDLEETLLRRLYRYDKSVFERYRMSGQSRAR